MYHVRLQDDRLPLEQAKRPASRHFDPYQLGVRLYTCTTSLLAKKHATVTEVPVDLLSSHHTPKFAFKQIVSDMPFTECWTFLPVHSLGRFLMVSQRSPN